jgi:hypothetical protein
VSLHRAFYIVTIWAEPSEPNSPRWRGYLETPNGTRKYFDSLFELNRLIRDASGWQEASEILPANEEKRHT